MLQLSHWPYIQNIALSGKLKTDVTNLLAANGKQETAVHCASVSEKAEEIAVRFGLDESLASIAALLHDVSNILRPQDMIAYAANHAWMIDESERKHPFLLHQRLSAVFAKELFGIDDPAVLSAIECHTTLKAHPSNDDMVLFLADKLSWDQAGTPPFYNLVSSALDHSLHFASLVYMNFVLDHGMILSPHKWLIDAKNWLDKHT